jgi:hypothetical protein
MASPEAPSTLNGSAIAPPSRWGMGALVDDSADGTSSYGLHRPGAGNVLMVATFNVLRLAAAP